MLQTLSEGLDHYYAEARALGIAKGLADGILAEEASKVPSPEADCEAMFASAIARLSTLASSR